MPNYKVPAMKITHPGAEFYIFIMNSDDLLDISYVSTDEKEKGVQRPLSEKRCKDVGKFIDSAEAIFANNIILNLPPETKYIEGKPCGTLIIPKKDKSAWVVDGQHRLYGFPYSKKNFDMMCSAFIDLDVDKEAEIFIKINKEQKGISESVIYDLLPLTKNAEFKKLRAQSLVKQLNEDPDSPWFDDIKMLGVGKGLVSQASFAQNLEKLVDPNGGVLISFDEATQFKILVNYFNAFKAVFEKEWGSKKYILTKTVGLAAMCGIFPTVKALCKNDLTKKNFIRVISSIETFDFSSVTRGGSSNKVAIQLIIGDILSRLPKLIETEDIKL